MMTNTDRTYLALGALALGLTLISFIPTDFWAVRALDMVREPATYLFTALLFLGLWFAKGTRGWIAALFGTAALINTVSIWPYSFLAPTEINLVEGGSDDRCFTAMSINVLMDNRDYDGVIDQVEQADPDVLLLTEPDREWIRRLRPLISTYPYSRTHPQENTYGKVFASRLEVVETAIADEAGDETPTLYALLRTSSSDLIRFIGLHPEPPLPGQDTDSRDEAILAAAEKADGQIAGGIVMGDFNDVPWSATTEKFREEGDWRDPRIGRGTYPTFPSNWIWLGWPLDQIMVTGDVEVASFAVLPHTGSDHRAIIGRFCLDRKVERLESER